MGKSIAKPLVDNYQVRLVICQMAVAFRDFGTDIWQLLSCYLKMGYTETGIAKWIAEKARKGCFSQQKVSEETEKALTVPGLPKWYLGALKKMPYFFSKNSWNLLCAACPHINVVQAQLP